MRGLAMLLAGLALLTTFGALANALEGSADRLQSSGVPVTGVVTDLIPVFSFSNPNYPSAIGVRYRFRGVTYSQTIRFNDANTYYAAGETVGLVVDAHDPSHVAVRGIASDVSPLDPVAVFSLVAGFVLTPVGFGWLIGTKRRHHVLSRSSWHPVLITRVAGRRRVALRVEDGPTEPFVIESPTGTLPKLGASSPKLAPGQLAGPVNRRVVVRFDDSPRMIAGRIASSRSARRYVTAEEVVLRGSARSVYRPNRVLSSGMILMGSAGLGMAVGAIYGAAVNAGSRGLTTDLFPFALGAGIFVLFGLGCLRAGVLKVVASEHGLRVVNYFRTYALGWDEIESFSAANANLGVSAKLSSGQIIRLNAIQKANLTTWMQEESWADAVADELNEQLKRRRPLAGLPESVLIRPEGR
jgi:hypothetical protein